MLEEGSSSSEKERYHGQVLLYFGLFVLVGLVLIAGFLFLMPDQPDSDGELFVGIVVESSTGDEGRTVKMVDPGNVNKVEVVRKKDGAVVGVLEPRGLLRFPGDTVTVEDGVEYEAVAVGGGYERRVSVFTG